jgi:hypothetical protein
MPSITKDLPADRAIIYYRRIFNHVKRFIPILDQTQHGLLIVRLRDALEIITNTRRKYESSSPSPSPSLSSSSSSPSLSSSLSSSPSLSLSSPAITPRMQQAGSIGRRHSESALSSHVSSSSSSSSSSSKSRKSKKTPTTPPLGLYRVGRV